ncbi:MAG: hypothetical protein WA840_01455 [Caulobacteraceae bacterium]
MKTTLLKKIEDFELWTTVSGSIQHFAIKTGSRKARVVETLAQAEEYLAKALREKRAARAH